MAHQGTVRRELRTGASTSGCGAGVVLTASSLVCSSQWVSEPADGVGDQLMFLSGLVLLVADRLELGRARGKGLGGALAQSVPPLVALIAVVL